MVTFLVGISVDLDLEGLVVLHIDVKAVIVSLGICFNATPPEL